MSKGGRRVGKQPSSCPGHRLVKTTTVLITQHDGHLTCVGAGLLLLLPLWRIINKPSPCPWVISLRFQVRWNHLTGRVYFICPCPGLQGVRGVCMWGGVLLFSLCRGQDAESYQYAILRRITYK